MRHGILRTGFLQSIFMNVSNSDAAFAGFGILIYYLWLG